MCVFINNFEVLPESSLIGKYVYRPPDSASMASTSIATMRDITLHFIWIENGWNIAQNNYLKGKQITLVGGYWLYDKYDIFVNFLVHFSPVL